MATKTIEPSKQADRAASLAVLKRGGPFTPSEYAALSALEPAELAAARFRLVEPTRSPDEIEDGARIEAAFGTRRAAAEADLAAAIATRETATEALFVARDVLLAVERVTWSDTSGRGENYVRGGTAEQVEAAKAALEDAERERRTAGTLEQAARVRVSTLGTAINNYGRELAAARTRK